MHKRTQDAIVVAGSYVCQDNNLCRRTLHLAVSKIQVAGSKILASAPITDDGTRRGVASAMPWELAGNMRGSQRARNILKAMGEEAFSWFNITVGYGPNAKMRRQRPPSGRQIAQLKREYLMRGETWPYEHLSPIELKPKVHPAKWPKGHKHELEAVKRRQTIAKNMEHMPKLIEEAKERKRLPEDIPPADRFFMSRKQLYNKYVRSRQRQK